MAGLWPDRVGTSPILYIRFIFISTVSITHDWAEKAKRGNITDAGRAKIELFYFDPTSWHYERHLASGEWDQHPQAEEREDSESTSHTQSGMHSTGTDQLDGQRNQLFC